MSYSASNRKWIPATPEEIESRIRQVALLLEAKWMIFDKVTIERRPSASRAPSPGFPSTEQKDNG